MIPALGPGDEGVGAIAAIKDVIADGETDGDEGVVASTAALVVAAGTTDEPVVTVVALEDVIAFCAIEEVIACSADELIGA